MLYIYDIVLNWMDVSKVYDFYEWEETDDIEHIKKIPIFRISSEDLDNVLNKDLKIIDFIGKINNLTEIYNNKKTNKIKYANIFSDTSRSIAVEYDNEGKIIYKSKMLLDEEEEANSFAEKLETTTLKYSIEHDFTNKEFNTRKEKSIKLFLEQEIKDSYKKKKYDKLRYIYSEYTDKEIDNVEEIYKNLILSLSDINDKHHKIYELITLSYKK